MKILVTGSSGLIGSEVVEYFDAKASKIIGVDNNMRADFFGPKGDTIWNLERLKSATNNFQHADLDIRNRDDVLRLLESNPFDLIVHCAAQPSHDLAKDRPFDDFDVNAVGTLNLLEAARRYQPETVFVHMSTNKVYGDAPNELSMKELETRWEYADDAYANGIDETMRIDRCKHSIFGASKAAADVMVQEYGKYFDMKTTCLRGGCLTGPKHSGVELHGFLNYLVKVNLEGGVYNIFGYKGKQVRDNIHSFDVARAIEEIYKNPRCGEVYNIGGGRGNSCSILEAFARVESISGQKMKSQYVEENRSGDHICYISDLAKLKSHYPNWDITKSLDNIFEEIVDALKAK